MGWFVNCIGNVNFIFDNVVYKLDKNGGEYNLYGGIVGFYKKVW